MVVLALLGCPKAPPPPPAAPPPRDDVLATVWSQTSAEAHAAALTVYQAAGAQLDRALEDPTWTASLEQSGDLGALTPAIVVDVDETVLDNSPYQVRNIRDGAGYDKATWAAWVDEAKARAIPGAAEFLTEAAAKGVDVFYVSNRSVGQEEATRKNLAAVGFPDTADTTAFLFRPTEGDKSKTARRTKIVETHRIVMLFGDNLFDFVEAEKPDRAARTALVEDHAGWWGERWFLVPNPMYGSWDDAVLQYAHPDPAKAHQERVHALDDAR
ncbi:MAG: acid phosphatase [Alphaproteobacteria bacterium]|nr:acid phosphatase [Alphaproteobacteria bacterium]